MEDQHVESCSYFKKANRNKKVFCTPVRKAVNPNSDKDYGE